MTDEPLAAPEDDELLAMEWALGLLDPAGRAVAELRAAEDPEFAASHERWGRLVLALLEGREEQPAPRVWTAIVRRLRANDPGSALRRWQAATAVAASIALALGATLMLQRETPPAKVEQAERVRPLVAVLASTEQDAIVAVSYDPALRLLTVLPRNLTTRGREAQLWIIPVGGKPIAAGLVRPNERTALVPEPQVAALIAPYATLAVSLEPRGGSTTGAPTGPVILTGIIARS